MILACFFPPAAQASHDPPGGSSKGFGGWEQFGVAFIVSTTVGGLCGQLETPSGQAWRPRIDSIGDACDIEGDIGKRIAEKSENRAIHLLRWHGALL